MSKTNNYIIAYKSRKYLNPNFAIDFITLAHIIEVIGT